MRHMLKLSDACMKAARYEKPLDSPATYAILAHMKRTSIYYTESMFKRLRLAVKKTGLSMSEMIRNAIDKYLTNLGL